MTDGIDRSEIEKSEVEGDKMFTAVLISIKHRK
jgi:hypothetical protein